MSSQIIKAPWTQKQVRNANKNQQSRIFHPYTCGSGRRTDAAHLDGEGVLIAFSDGWHCPYCDYKQDWALDHVFEDLSDYEATRKALP